MASTFAVLALVLSAGFLAIVVTALVLLRRGDGPRYSVSRAYDESRRRAVELLTGEAVEAVTGGQWYDPARKAARPDDPAAPAWREAATLALRATLPAERPLEVAPEGALAAGGARIVPALSTADLRDAMPMNEDGALVVGLVLFNAEPPGGAATRVALPPQALFPALERAGRGDLVRRIEDLAREARSAAAGPRELEEDEGARR